MNPSSRLRIVGIEVVGLGAFSLLMFFLELDEANGNSTAGGFAWVFAILGITLILVGLEELSLIRKL